MPLDSPFLVVGAGPVGLTMANELVRHGLRCRIIDQARERSQTSKALAIFPRTLEVLDTMGVASRFLDAGHRLQGLSLHYGADDATAIDFNSVASPFPFALSLPQSETERLLCEELGTRGVEVEREVSLTGIEQTNESVRANLRRADGGDEVVETPWLFGCDGAHSTTRHVLGMEFEGAQYDESFILADVQIATDLDRDRAHLFLVAEGVMGLFPFGGDRWRIVASIPPESRVQALPELTLDEVQTLTNRRGQAGMQLSDPVWMSRFHISHRIVPQFRKLRTFLLGDAAHIHSPAGGQGMNTGMQDAFNLAWKVALVARGQAPVQLLGSYHAEREPAARGVLNLTDRLTRMATVQNPIVRGVRDLLLPVVGGIELLGDKIADRLAELAVNYRASGLVENHGAGRVRAGDRAPDADLRTEENEARRFFEVFREPRHVLLLFLGAKRANLAAAERISEELSGFPTGAIDTFRIARGESGLTAELYDRAGLAHATYGLLNGGVVLVRPDGYVGYRNDNFDPVTLRAWLARTFLSPPPPGVA